MACFQDQLTSKICDEFQTESIHSASKDIHEVDKVLNWAYTACEWRMDDSEMKEFLGSA